MNKQEYLNEENYQKGKKKITNVALIVLIIGLLIGGSFIAIGFNRQSKVDAKYSTENKANLEEQAETERQNLLKVKSELEEKIKPTKDEIKRLQREPFTGFDDAYYEREDKIEELEQSIASEEKDLSVINGVLNDAEFDCKFDGGKNKKTSTYCSLITQLEKTSNSFNKSFDSFSSFPFYMLGGFSILASCMIAFSIYMVTKRREIMAFTTQQVMPVAQEGMDKMAPTIGNVAKEITKGIKEGLKDEEK